ncbi:RNA polymerase sigma factor [Puia sp. P3]|uniref:RNA polymerase sigma factor n=1 Tax=Puia sp. P3 TaxID=3423952 RepID=UPI003D67EFB2
MSQQDTTHNELALISSIAAGDPMAFEQLYRLYSGKVYNSIMVYIKDESEAEELVQQVFVRLWDRRSNLTAVRQFDDYFFILIRNTVFNYFDRHSRQARQVHSLETQSDELADDDAPDHPIQEKQYEQLVQKAIHLLPDRQRQVYQMVNGEALGYDDIAQRMQISRLTAKKHMELARKAIREYISRHLIFLSSLTPLRFYWGLYRVTPF